MYDHNDESTLIPPRVRIPGEPDPDSSDDETLAGRAKDALREKAFEVAIDKGGTMLGVPTGIIQAFAGGSPVGIGLVMAAFLMRRVMKRKPLRSVGKRVRGRMRDRKNRRRARRHTADEYDDDHDDDPDDGHHGSTIDGHRDDRPDHRPPPQSEPPQRNADKQTRSGLGARAHDRAGERGRIGSYEDPPSIEQTQPSTLPDAADPDWARVWADDWKQRGGDPAIEAMRLDCYREAVRQLGTAGLPGVPASPNDAHQISAWANGRFAERVGVQGPRDTPTARAMQGVAFRAAVAGVRNGEVTAVNGDREATAMAIENFVNAELGKRLTT